MTDEAGAGTNRRRRRRPTGSNAKRSERQVKQRRRGTAIIEYKRGILVVSMNGRGYLTPGGGANRNESRMQAVIREIKEETGIEPYFAMALFRYDGPKRKTHQNVHTIYYVRAKGTPKPRGEIVKVAYYEEGSKLPLSNETRDVIERFLEFKRENEDFFDRIPSFKTQGS